MTSTTQQHRARPAGVDRRRLQIALDAWGHCGSLNRPESTLRLADHTRHGVALARGSRRPLFAVDNRRGRYSVSRTSEAAIRRR